MINTAVRWSGLALVEGALGVGAATVLITLNLPERDPMPLESILLFIASILFMLALPAMYVRQAEAAGRLGLVGYVLLEIGNVLYLVYAGGPLLNPADKGLGESLAAFLLALALLSGFVLTAIATLRAAVYPRWSGILLLVTGLGFLFGFFIAEDLPPIIKPLNGAFEAIVLASAFAGIGVSLWRGAVQKKSTEQSSG